MKTHQIIQAVDQNSAVSDGYGLAMENLGDPKSDEGKF